MNGFPWQQPSAIGHQHAFDAADIGQFAVVQVASSLSSDL
jgi:hypothetical protein